MKRTGKTSRTPPAQPTAGRPGPAWWQSGQVRAFTAVMLVTCTLAYLPVLGAGFVNWDDGDYVYRNTAIQSFGNLHDLLLKPVQGNHHPLTMLSLALNYAVSGYDARSYHLLNLLLHLANTLWVLVFVMALTRGKVWISLATAALFGLHPMHVESVAWVAERKDVLYAFFFLPGLISYIEYVHTGRRSYLALAFLLFVLSLLSKPAAVSFPLVLLVLDFYFGRLRAVGTWLEKLLFAVPAAIMGLLTIHAQSAHGAIAAAGAFHIGARILFGFYGLMMYAVRAVIPYGLVPYYPAPAATASLPVPYYLSPLFVVALAAYGIYSLKHGRLIATGLLFYLVNLLLVLQVFPVGTAIVADRYSYLPLIGLFLVPGWYLQRHAERARNGSPLAAGLLFGAACLVLSVATFYQAGIWKSGETLWSHAIKHYPSARAHTNLGLLYSQQGNNSKAMEHYGQALRYQKQGS